MLGIGITVLPGLWDWQPKHNEPIGRREAQETVYLGSGTETIYGGLGADTINTGSGANDIVYAGDYPYPGGHTTCYVTTADHVTGCAVIIHGAVPWLPSIPRAATGNNGSYQKTDHVVTRRWGAPFLLACGARSLYLPSPAGVDH